VLCRGVLFLDIRRAAGLPAGDWLTGDTAAYALASVAGQSRRTGVAPGTRCPDWNATFEFFNTRLHDSLVVKAGAAATAPYHCRSLDAQPRVLYFQTDGRTPQPHTRCSDAGRRRPDCLTSPRAPPPRPSPAPKQVKDHDFLKPDDELGRVEIPIKELVQRVSGGTRGLWEGWWELGPPAGLGHSQRKARGRLEMRVQYRGYR
jgi:hypothetical protein